jgi:hypothetical protein
MLLQTEAIEILALVDEYPVDLVFSKLHGMYCNGMYCNVFPSSINEKSRAPAVQGQKKILALKCAYALRLQTFGDPKNECSIYLISF